MSVGGVLQRIVDALDAQGIPHMLVGSFASSVHGAARTTKDINLVVDPSPETLDRFLASLDDEVYYVDRDVARSALRTRGMFNVIDLQTGWKVDIIVRKPRDFSREELSRRQLDVVDGVRVHVSSPEDTVVAKLEWSKSAGGSERQRADAREIVAVQGDALDRAYIERWVAELGLADEWAIVSAAD